MAACHLRCGVRHAHDAPAYRAAESGTSSAGAQKGTLCLGAVDLGARELATLFVLLVDVCYASTAEGLEKVKKALHSPDPRAFQDFQPRSAEIGLSGEDRYRGGLQRVLMRFRAEWGALSRQIGLLRGTDWEAKLAVLRTSKWGKKEYGARMLAAAQRNDEHALKVIRRRLAKMHRSLRLAQKRKSRTCEQQVTHYWRGFAAMVGGFTDLAYIGKLDKSVLRNPQPGDRRKFSLPRKTKFTLTRGRVLSVPARMEKKSAELNRGCLVEWNGEQVLCAGQAECGEMRAIAESYTTSACGACQRLVDVGGKASWRGRAWACCAALRVRAMPPHRTAPPDSTAPRHATGSIPLSTPLRSQRGT